MLIPTAEIVVNGRKKIVNADDPRVKEFGVAVSEEKETEEVTIPSRTDIARMSKAEVVEWLEAHGVEAPNGKLADLKAELAAIMFVEG